MMSESAQIEYATTHFTTVAVTYSLLNLTRFGVFIALTVFEVIWCTGTGWLAGR